MYLGGLGDEKAGWFRSGRVCTQAGEVIAPPSEADAQAATALLEEHVRSLACEDFSSQNR